MLTLLQRANQKSLPKTEEWLWEIEHQNDRVLRTACFHEYARETEPILELVERIDEVCKELNLDHTDCRQLLAGSWVRLNALVRKEPGNGFELLTALRTLELMVWPLHPHVLLCRELGATPFFSLEQKFGKKFMSDTDLLPERGYEDDGITMERLENALATLHLPHYCWFVRAEKLYSDLIKVSDITPKFIGEGFSPPDYMFENDDGSRGVEATATMLLVLRPLLERTHPMAMARLLVEGHGSAPECLRGMARRLNCRISAGMEQVEILPGGDQVPGYDGEHELIGIVAHAKAGERNIAHAIEVMVRHFYTTRQKSILATREPIYRRKDGKPGKSNTEYFMSALASLSAIRLGTTLDAEDLIRLRRIIGDMDYIPRIPHTNVSHIKGGLKRYREYAAQIFPELSDDDRDPWCMYNPDRTRRNWTIERYKGQVSVRLSRYKDPKPPANTKTPPLS